MVENAKKGSPTALFNTPNKGAFVGRFLNTSEYKKKFISKADSQHQDLHTI